MKHILKIGIISIALFFIFSCDNDIYTPINSTSFIHTGQHEVVAKVERIATKNLGFIVSKSTTAPDYEVVKTLTHVFYTRQIDSSGPVYIYLSATDKTPIEYVNFDVSDNTQFLKEDNKYYLYVYDIDTTTPQDSVVSFDFKTLSLPTKVTADTPEQYFDMATLSVNPISYKAGELLIIPIRVARTITDIEIFGPQLIGANIGECSKIEGFCDSEISGVDLFFNYLNIGTAYTTTDLLIFMNLNTSMYNMIGKYSLAHNDKHQTIFNLYEVK